jgi:hypothetical protein
VPPATHHGLAEEMAASGLSETGMPSMAVVVTAAAAATSTAGNDKPPTVLTAAATAVGWRCRVSVDKSV